MRVSGHESNPAAQSFTMGKLVLMWLAQPRPFNHDAAGSNTMTSTPVHKPRFRCTGCGKCCTGDPAHHYVEVSRAEQRRIYSHLGISARVFRRKFIEIAGDESEGIQLLDSGHCPFLGSDNRCSIYGVRPNQCLTYPIWPELVSRAENWQRESKRCEGIGQGPIISETEISARLTMHRK